MDDAGIAGRLRRGLLLLAGLGLAGTALDLGAARHWQSAIQLVPWACLAVAATGIILVAVRPTGPRIRLARLLMIVVAACAVLGVYEHVAANYAAAPLDFRFATRWEGMSSLQRWWAAATQAVGPSPPVAPAALAWTALCGYLATLGLPVSAGSAPSVPAGRGERAAARAR